jgi:hypothetical protein
LHQKDQKDSYNSSNFIDFSGTCSGKTGTSGKMVPAEMV